MGIIASKVLKDNSILVDKIFLKKLMKRKNNMGQYKLWVRAKCQIGFLFYYEKHYSFQIHLPFISIHIGLMSDAKGIRIFNKEF